MRAGDTPESSTDLVGWLPMPEVDPVPHAAIATARRIRGATLRLLQSGAYDYKALAEGRNASVETTRQFVSRAQRKQQIFTVEYNGAVLVPAFLLDEALDPVPEYADVLGPLLHTVASARYPAQPFDASGLGSARFSPLPQPDGPTVGHMYVGSTSVAALLETTFHEVGPGRTNQIAAADLTGWHLRLVIPQRPLRLADLRDERLSALGLASENLVATSPAHYPCTRRALIDEIANLLEVPIM